jgi:hypothetical protein
MGVKMGEYLAVNFSVSSISGLTIRVTKDLGRPATVGKIWNDGGTQFFQISPKDGGAVGENKLAIYSGQEFELKAEHRWVIGEILITTDSAVSVSGRLFLK